MSMDFDVQVNDTVLEIIAACGLIAALLLFGRNVYPKLNTQQQSAVNGMLIMGAFAIKAAPHISDFLKLGSEVPDDPCEA